MSQTATSKNNTHKFVKQESAKSPTIPKDNKNKSVNVKKQNTIQEGKSKEMNEDLGSTTTGYQSIKNSTMTSSQMQRPASSGKQDLPASAKIYSQKIAEIEKGAQELQQKKLSQTKDDFQMEKIDLGLCMNPKAEQNRPSVPQEKKIKAKVNSGLKRSKSNMSKKKSSYKDQSPQNKPADTSPKGRLETDLVHIKKQMTSQQKEGIMDTINEKYAQLEWMLTNNLPGSESPLSSLKKGKSDASDMFERASNQDILQLGQTTGNLSKIVEDIKERQAKEEPIRVVKKEEEEAPQKDSRVIELKRLTNTAHEGQILYSEQDEPEKKEEKKKKKSSKKPKQLNKDLEVPAQKVLAAPQKSKSQNKVQQNVKAEQKSQVIKKVAEEVKPAPKSKPVSRKSFTKPKVVTKQESEKFSQTFTGSTLAKQLKSAQPLVSAPKTPKTYKKQNSLTKAERSKPLQKTSTFSKPRPQTAMRKSISSTQQVEVLSNRVGSPKSSLYDLSPKKSGHHPQKLSKAGYGCKSTASFKKHGKLKLDFAATNQLEMMARSKIKMEDGSPSNYHSEVYRGNKSSHSQYNLTTKEDYINFDIEHVWKEMEELGRAKREKDDAFTQFQDKFYDRKAAKFNDTAETSPTKRLVQLKNATFKHHAISHQKGIKDDVYQIQYTTGPGKSIVVKPEEGEIQYSKYSNKKTHKLVTRILNGEVEEIKMIERCKSPVKREKINSPVKILSQHVKRLEMGSKPANRINQDSVSSPQLFGGSIESDSKNDNEGLETDGNLNIQLGEYMQTEEVEYRTVENGQAERGLLVEARK